MVVNILAINIPPSKMSEKSKNGLDIFKTQSKKTCPDGKTP
jgi:hypothetical protein